LFSFGNGGSICPKCSQDIIDEIVESRGEMKWEIRQRQRQRRIQVRYQVESIFCFHFGILELLVPASVLGKSNLTESPSLGLRNKTSLQTVFEQLVLGGRALAVVIITVAVFVADQRVACYKNSKKLPPVRLDTFTTLKIYF
jgi:hypothetical protein